MLVMKHWIARLLGAVVLWGLGLFRMARNLSRWPQHQAFGGENAGAAIRVAGDSVEEAVAALHDEFFKHQAIKPSLEARQRIQELAARTEEDKMVLILDDWLRQMFNAGQADGEEFRELAVWLLAVEPEAQGREAALRYAFRRGHGVLRQGTDGLRQARSAGGARGA